jgi:general secretion pathway protein D
MKLFQCSCLVLLVALVVTLPSSASSAGSLYSKGQHAEARQQYEEAYQYYKQAYDLHPEKTEYRSAFDRTRFLAASSHVHRGQVLRDEGKLSEALKEFQLAAMIDSSIAIAQEEIKRTEKLIEKAQQPAPPISRAPQEGLSESASSIAGPVQLAPISQTPLTLKLSEDSKTVYETIGKLAGINVLFDPDYVPRRIRIELNAVSLEQALEVVALESHTFWRPVTPNTIYVAQDTQQKRTEIEQQVLRTFYLNNFSTVSELQDVANLIRTILKVERVQQFPAQNVIVMRGTPDQVALAELLISNLDKAKPEVVVDVVVMQVSKMKLQQLGIQYPFQGGTTNPTITFQSPTTATSTSTTTTSSTGTTTTTSGLTLNSLAHLNATDFAVTIPPSSVAFLMQDSNTNVIQRPQIRSADGQKATLKIGERVPIAVGTSSSTLTATALTQTQFQYQDVGVNIELTPHIHSDTDVSLKISIEVSAIDSYQTIGGLTEPVIGQRKVDQEIRMRDGEVNLIGGMMEHDDVQNMSGLPWLSQIPILKYLFGQGEKTKTDNETVFALMPHVVRRLSIDDLNIRPVDIGTQNVVEVRHTAKAPVAVPPPASVPSSVPSTTAPATPPAVPAAPATVPATPPVSSNPGAGQNPHVAQPQVAGNGAAANGVASAEAAQPPANTAPAAAPSEIGPVLSLDPPMVNQPTGGTFALNVTLNGGKNVFSVPVQVTYDPKVMQFVNVSNAGALSKDGAAVALVHRDDGDKGTLQVSLMRPPGSTGINPSGPLFTMMFVAKAAGQGTVSVGQTVLRDPNMVGTVASGSQAIINVR